MLSTTLIHQHLLCREQMSPPSLHRVPLFILTHPCRVRERHLMYRGWSEDLLSQPHQARGSGKEQPKRVQFYEWLLRVLDKKNHNLSWTHLLKPLLA